MQGNSPAARQAAAIAGDCYYEHTVQRGLLRPALAGRQDADVVVIGAGAAGLACALECAARGDRVMVLEAERIGSAASGRNGGQVLPGYSADLETLQRDLGALDARRAWDMSVEGVSLVKQRARVAVDQCELTSGWMMLAARRGHVTGLRAWYRQLRDGLGYADNVAFVEREEVGDYCAGKGYHAALIDRNAAHLNPLKLMLSMAQQATKLGVEIFEDSRVLSILPGQTGIVRTAAGEVHCRHVIIAANVFIDGLGIPAASHVMSVGNTMIATERLPGDIASALCKDGFAGCDTNFMLDYFRVSADQRLLFGGASTYLRPAGDAARALRTKMIARFPQLREARIDYTWGGLIDVTASRAPDFGRLGAGIVYLQGFSGHGLNVSAIAGRVVAEALHGESDRLALFGKLRHRSFPSNVWLRRGLLSMGTWFYRLRDQLG